MHNLIAIIPTTASRLNTFGLDFAVPAQYDPETGDCIVDADWLDWVEIGPFDPEHPELTDPRIDHAVRNRLDEAAQTAGYGLDWDTYRETTTWEFHEVDAYRLDQGEKPMTTTQIGTFDYTIPAEFFGDYAGTFDIDAINDEVLDELNAMLPRGVTVARNGMIFAEVEMADEAREIDFAELLDAIDVATIANAHEVTKWPPPRPAGSRARV